MTTKIRQSMRTYQISLQCDCGGEMLPTGLVLYTDPPLYPHCCQLCEKESNEDQRYPTIEYEPEPSQPLPGKELAEKYGFKPRKDREPLWEDLEWDDD